MSQNFKKAEKYIEDKFNGSLLEFNSCYKIATFKCNNNHTFTKSYQTVVYYNSWCAQCKKNKNKIDRFNKFKEVIESKGGVCLFSEYIDHSSKTKIKCKKGHIWESTYLSIVLNGRWCPECGGVKKLTIADAKNIAIERHGRCISNKYVNSNEKLKWTCYLGHEWVATLSSVKNNNGWCPKCNINTGEEITRKIFNLLFDREFIRCKPIWLNGLELDGFCKFLNISFEYDGIQHFKFIERFHKTKEGFNKSLERDLRKNKLCIENNVKLIRISYLTKLDKIKENIINQCNEKKICVPNPNVIINTKEFGDIYRKNVIKYGNLKKIVKLKSGTIVDKSYISNDYKIKFSCNSCHEWTATPHKIKSGDWCPYCSKKKKHTIETMGQIAEKNNGKCLSQIYVNNSTKLMWKCKNNHTWDAVPKSILKGHWCAKCASGRKKCELNS